jgi:hypothetical protein
MSSSYSWRPAMETSGVTGNREGYCNEATQGRPLTHSESHQAQNITKHTEVKQRMAWTKEEVEKIYDAISIANNISQQAIRNCMKYGDNEIQNAESAWMQRNSKNRKTMS